MFITGRLKDLIIMRGLNHYPNDIEQTVEKADAGIRPSCVAAFTIDDDTTPRLVVACEIERRDSGRAEEIIEALRRDVGREHELIVDCVVLLKSGVIPKTSSGKIQRHACRSALFGRHVGRGRAMGLGSARASRAGCQTGRVQRPPRCHGQTRPPSRCRGRRGHLAQRGTAAARRFPVERI